MRLKELKMFENVVPFAQGFRPYMANVEDVGVGDIILVGNDPPGTIQQIKDVNDHEMKIYYTDGDVVFLHRNMKVKVIGREHI